jgi:phosphoribosylamine--glycine ligase
MITKDQEISLLEFNVRFGDPETQVLMAVLDGDVASALASAARGELEPDLLQVSSDHSLCVVLAAKGYPQSPHTGQVINGLEAAGQVPGVQVFHSGTRLQGGQVVTAGGRVLGVTARATSLSEARARAYQAAELIQFEGRQFRRDIAARALSGPS